MHMLGRHSSKLQHPPHCPVARPRRLRLPGLRLVAVERRDDRVLSSVSSFADLFIQVVVHLLPAAEKTRSTPADDAGHAKYCFTILARFGHLVSFAAHQDSTLTSISG